jgi:hypothetical protein
MMEKRKVTLYLLAALRGFAKSAQRERVIFLGDVTSSVAGADT